MKITVKRNLIIFHDPEDWAGILHQLVAEHGPKITISWVMRRELGFTVRSHLGLMPAGSRTDPSKMYYQTQIHLDFFTESTQSWFQLKYLNRPDSGPQIT